MGIVSDGRVWFVIESGSYVYGNWYWCELWWDYLLVNCFFVEEI